MHTHHTRSLSSPILTDRDVKIFQKLSAAGWLTTGQILRYYFPDKKFNDFYVHSFLFSYFGYSPVTSVVETPYNPPVVRVLDDLDDSRLSEIEHFFVSYNEAEGRKFKPLGRHGPQRAIELLEAATPKK